MQHFPADSKSCVSALFFTCAPRSPYAYKPPGPAGRQPTPATGPRTAPPRFPNARWRAPQPRASRSVGLTHPAAVRRRNWRLWSPACPVPGWASGEIGAATLVHQVMHACIHCMRELTATHACCSHAATREPAFHNDVQSAMQ
eukprot:366052-Chlamydomonas_euryale.AAC.26